MCDVGLECGITNRFQNYPTLQQASKLKDSNLNFQKRQVQGSSKRFKQIASVDVIIEGLGEQFLITKKLQK